MGFDGNDVDFILAMGPLIHGHCHPKINGGSGGPSYKGTMFALLHEKEVFCRESSKNGTQCKYGSLLRNLQAEMTSNAMRIARGVTGKDKIIKFEGAYHGSHDYVLTGGLGYPSLGPSISPTKIPALGVFQMKCLIRSLFFLGMIWMSLKRP